jgi:hypothetical protein
MKPFWSGVVIFTACTIVMLDGAQPKGQSAKPSGKALEAQSQSSITYNTSADGSKTVEIHNITFEYTGSAIPGRPSNERLVLRTAPWWDDPAQKPDATGRRAGRQGGAGRMNGRFNDYPSIYRLRQIV